MKKIILSSLCAVFFQTAFAWNYEGHRLVNQLALASLPTNFPAFVHTAAAEERVAFLAGEPDRWRNMPDISLRQYNEPDHYMDVEELALYGLKPETLPVLRDDFIAQLTLARAAHPEKMLPIDQTKNPAHVRELVGLLPWAITEQYGKLKSGFSYLKAFEESGGTPEEIANAQANIIYIMGVMGHYAGDSAQPLHTTLHFNGWAGENPEHYTTNKTFHGWIDGGYIAKVNIQGDLSDMKKKLRPAQFLTLNQKPAATEETFQAVMAFISEQNKLVEPLYKMEKAHELSGEGENGLKGKPFIEGQLINGGQFLGDIWYSAWQQAPADTYLKRDLEKRKAATKP
jgi:hypothetical protein